jgi:hypothetical protein
MDTSPAQDTRIGVELESMASEQTGTTEVDSLCNRSEEEGRVNPDLRRQEHPQDRHGLIVTFVLQLFCFLWLAPIVTLLTFNLMQYIVGASAWCPHRKCNPGLFDPAFSTTSQRFDEQDHNLLGAPQIVAKLLEIWFTLIAAALVSKMTFWLARRNEGLPIGLLTRPSGFADLPGTLVEPLLRKARTSTSAPKTVFLDTVRRIWTAMLLIFSSNQSGSRNTHRWRIRIFVAITAILCMVCNLMGPAVAVLVLPTLRWIPTTSVGDRTFDSMGAGEPPQTGLSGERDRYFSMYTPDC